MGPALVLVGLLALALNLRTALAGYPPLIETAREDLGLSAGVAGLVQSGAVLMMSVASFVGARIGTRFGHEQALGVAVALVVVGSLARGWPAVAALVVGSLVLGFGIGLAGVLLTGVVKDHLAARPGLATGGYTVAMMVGATVASAAAVPLAGSLGGWSFSLAVWAVPAALALGLWAWLTYHLTQGARHADDEPRRRQRGRAPWRTRLGVLTALYMAGASLSFYGWLTWLAPYYESLGWSPQLAGFLLAAWNLVQIPGNLLFPALAERRRRWRFWAGTGVLCGVVGSVGVLGFPEPPVVGPWPWIVLLALCMASGFSLGLTVIAWRTPNAATSAAVSGFALGAGYLAAGVGPLLMGVLIDLTGGYLAALLVLLAATLLQGVGVVLIGDRAPGE